MSISKTPYGVTQTGEAVDCYTFKNARGSSLGVITYGAAITSFKTADKHGKFADIVLGFDTLAEYEEKSPYFGCIVGRYANRIDSGKFELEGQTYSLALNDGDNHLHGGDKGFDKVVWRAELEGDSLVLRYTSPDGEEGYPGQLELRVSYTLTEANELRIDYWAQCDKTTIVNLTNHSYFNLAATGTILSHDLMINADSFIPISKQLIPTGEIRDVAATPFDFRTPHRIGTRIDEADAQLQAGLGYDHCWVLNKEAAELALAARVQEASSGRCLTVYTTHPGLQFYAGNMLDTFTARGGQQVSKRSALCLETQDFPDAVNQPSFPSTVLRPGDTYEHTTLFAFSTD